MLTQRVLAELLEFLTNSHLWSAGLAVPLADWHALRQEQIVPLRRIY